MTRIRYDFSALYIFSVEALLLMFVVICILTKAVNSDMITVLTTIGGGLLTHLGQIVSHTFKDATRQPERKTDSSNEPAPTHP